MGCRDRCEVWNSIRTVARPPLIGVSWIGIFVGWQYWSCWRYPIVRFDTSIMGFKATLYTRTLYFLKKFQLFALKYTLKKTFTY